MEYTVSYFKILKKTKHFEEGFLIQWIGLRKTVGIPVKWLFQFGDQHFPRGSGLSRRVFLSQVSRFTPTAMVGGAIESLGGSI
jgi:hypothetical protein